MPFIRSLVSKRHARVVALILLLGEIMPTYSYCAIKGLVYVAIVTPFGQQPSFYSKCMKLNMRFSYNI
jgi:hypothetical protein